MWSIFEMVPWGAEKKVHSFTLGLYVLYISINSSWFKVSASFAVSLFSFCFHDLSIGESGVLKSPTIIVWGEMYFWALVGFLL